MASINVAAWFIGAISAQDIITGIRGLHVDTLTHANENCKVQNQGLVLGIQEPKNGRMEEREESKRGEHIRERKVEEKGK